MRVAHAAALVAETVGLGHDHVAEAIGRVVGAEGVAEGRRAQHFDAGRRLVDEEQRVGAGVRPVRDPRLQDEVVGVVGARDVPLLAGDRVATLGASRRRLDHDVRARAGLGDRVAFLPRPAHERQDEAPDLVFGAGLEHPALGLGEAPAQRVRHAAELLPDRDLVDDPQFEPAVRLRHVHRAEAELDGEFLVPLLDVRRQAALVELGLDLVRDELVGRESEGPVTPFPGGWVERDIHPRPCPLRPVG